MAERLVSRFMRSLGVDVIRRDAALEDVLASAMTEKLNVRLLPIIRRRDNEGFIEVVRTGVDEPGFDKAFDAALDAACANGWVTRSDCDMLRSVALNAAAEQIVAHPRAKDEYFVMFAVPVQGRLGTLGEAFESGDAGSVLADAMKKSRFVDEGAEVTFLPAVFNLGDLSEAGPACLRYAAASLGVAMLSDAPDAQKWKAARTVARRLSGERQTDGWDDPSTDSEIRFAVGGYYRQWRSDEMTADALLMSVGKYDDAPAHLAARRRDFMAEVEETAEFRAGAPAIVPRACSQLAYMHAVTSLLNSAGSQGLVSPDTTRLQPDDLVYFVRDGNMVILAKFGDDVANSDPLPYSMVAGDIEHFRSLLKSIHPAARPMVDSVNPEPGADPHTVRR